MALTFLFLYEYDHKGVIFVSFIYRYMYIILEFNSYIKKEFYNVNKLNQIFPDKE